MTRLWGGALWNSGPWGFGWQPVLTAEKCAGKDCRSHRQLGSPCLIPVPAPCVYHPVLYQSLPPGISLVHHNNWKYHYLNVIAFLQRDLSLSGQSDIIAMMDHLRPYALKDTHPIPKPKIMSQALWSLH